MEALKVAKTFGTSFKKYNSTYYDKTVPTCQKYNKGKSGSH